MAAAGPDDNIPGRGVGSNQIDRCRHLIVDARFAFVDDPPELG
jgi:hypothetical protein